MCPPVSPYVSSKSCGVMIWWVRISSGKFGAYCARVLTTVSPSGTRSDSQLLAFRGQRWIGQRGNCDLQIRLLGEIAVFGFVESTFKIINLRPNVDAAFKCLSIAIQRRKLRQAGQRKIDFCHGSRHAVVPELHHEIRREM